jgi:hypothetical protein
MKALSVMAAALCLLASSAAAQTYTRTESNAGYSERTGNGVNAPFTEDSYDDGCRFVPLPFAFPFFDRTYRGAWMNTNGRIHFRDEDPQDYDTTNLTPTVTEVDVIESINVIASDVTGAFQATRNSHFRAFHESGRVVFQWSDVTFYASDERLLTMNFQCHIFPSGEIRMHFGPTSFIINDTDSYVSGIVNSDGTESYPGFGNTLAFTSTLPSNGTLVSLVPSGYTQADGVVLSPRSSFNYTPKVVFEGETGVVVGSFRLDANGTGGTVDEITVQHEDATGNTLSLMLYRDAGTLGVFDGADVLMGTQAMGTGSTSFTGLTELLDGTTPTRHYLLVVDATNIDEDFDSYFFMNVYNDGDISTTGADVWGGYFAGDDGSDPEEFSHLFLEGPMVEYNVSNAPGRLIPAFAGGAERELASFEVKLKHSNGQPVVLNSFDADLIGLVDVVLADVAAVRLYRDRGTPGVLDGSDTLIGTIANPATPALTFSALAEDITANGQDYLITIQIAASFTMMSVGEVDIFIDESDEVFTPAIAFWESCDSDSPAALRVMPNVATISLRLNEATSFNANNGALPVAQGTTNVPVLNFILQASTGTQSVTGIDISGNGSLFSAARLYIDNGSQPGRVDAGDTMVATATTLSGTNITFTALTETVGVAGTSYLVAGDLIAAAATGFHTFTLTAGNVTAGVTVLEGGNQAFSILTVRDATTAGVNVTVTLVNPGSDIRGNEWVLVARVLQAPRGVGGEAEGIAFRLLDAAGGVGYASLELLAYFEGSGPVGQLDSTDIPSFFDEDDLDPDATVELSDEDVDYITTPRNFLIFARVSTDACDFDGPATLQFWGLTNTGTAAILTALPTPVNGSTTVVVTPSSKKGGGGGGDDGGCTTGGSQGNWMLFLLALSGIVLASRLRRARQ